MKPDSLLEAKANSPEWLKYQALMRERPALFAPSELLEIVTSLDAVCRFEAETPGRKIGVLYESPFSLLAVDLVRDRTGRLFCYERILPAQPRGAVVAVPVFEGKYVLLRQFRHALRAEQYCFPRGFGEPGIPAGDNVRKELKEEIGADVLSARRLGAVSGDSGLTGGMAEVYLCRIDRPCARQEEEGILEVLLLSPGELRQWIREGKITDAFTLAAWALAAETEK